MVLPDKHEKLPVGDAVEPSFDLAWIPEGFPMDPGLEPHVLQQILGVVPVSDKVTHKAGQGLPKMRHKAHIGLELPPLKAPDKLA